MKKFLFCLVAILLSSVSSLLSHEYMGDALEEQRVYLSQDQVVVFEKQLYAQLNCEWIPVNAVHYDIQGVYVESADIIASESGRWWCPRCKKLNEADNRKCWNCGLSKP